MSFIALSSPVTQHPYQLNSVVFSQFHKGLLEAQDQFRVDLVIVECLDHSLNIRWKVDISVLVALICIIYFTCLDGIHLLLPEILWCIAQG
jgi:hypothetical protein